MSVLNREEIFAESELKTEKVALSSGDVIVSGLSGPDYIKLYTDPSNQKETGEFEIKDGQRVPVTTIEMGRFQACLIAYGTVDEAGNRIFEDTDIPKIVRFSQGPFLKLAEVARRLNGFGDDEIKNSDDNLNESSSSDSALN